MPKNFYVYGFRPNEIFIMKKKYVSFAFIRSRALILFKVSQNQPNISKVIDILVKVFNFLFVSRLFNPLAELLMMLSPKFF